MKGWSPRKVQPAVQGGKDQEFEMVEAAEA